ncbi:hypothetical protein MMC29_003828 [Sticta canariensis]|nr:hypothetical protein [Sticta canariensis]
MARREQNTEVISQLENVMKICMEEKQKTLRPEIQLLNTLLQTQSRDSREKIMSTPESIEAMRMNNEYFDSLINRMITATQTTALADVDRQPAAAQKSPLLQQLKEIQQEATALKART